MLLFIKPDKIFSFKISMSRLDMAEPAIVPGQVGEAIFAIPLWNAINHKSRHSQKPFLLFISFKNFLWYRK